MVLRGGDVSWTGRGWVRPLQALSFLARRPQISAMTSQSPNIKILPETPIRAPSAVPIDDAVLPFEVAALDLRGRLTRLGPALDDVLSKHDYPAPVGKLLGEAIVLTTLLGSSLKFEGRFILQTQTDGPVSFLIVDFQAPESAQALSGECGADEAGPQGRHFHALPARPSRRGSHR